MVGWIILGVFIALLLLLLLIPLGVDVGYEGGEFHLSAKAGGVLIQLFPKKPGEEKPEKEKKPKKKKEKKEPEEEPQEKEPKKKRSLPFNRDELLELLLSLRDQGVTVLFSTHITSDLEHCADDLLYIQNGRLLAQDSLEGFADRYRLVQMEKKPADTTGLLGLRRERDRYTALVRTAGAEARGGVRTDLETIMVHLEREVGA